MLEPDRDDRPELRVIVQTALAIGEEKSRGLGAGGQRQLHTPGRWAGYCVVGSRGIEPLTSSMSRKRSNQLS